MLYISLITHIHIHTRSSICIVNIRTIFATNAIRVHQNNNKKTIDISWRLDTLQFEFEKNFQLKFCRRKSFTIQKLDGSRTMRRKTISVIKWMSLEEGNKEREGENLIDFQNLLQLCEWHFFWHKFYSLSTLVQK